MGGVAPGEVRSVSSSAGSRWKLWVLFGCGILWSVPVLAWFLTSAPFLDGTDLEREVVIGIMVMAQLAPVCGPLLCLVHGAATLRFLSQGLWRKSMATGSFFLTGTAFLAHVAWMLSSLLT